MSERNPTIKFADMSEEMISEAQEIAGKAIELHVTEKDIAQQIKREFDKKHSPTWQCIVGREFVADVIHEAKHFIYFYVGQLAILLWKTD